MRLTSAHGPILDTEARFTSGYLKARNLLSDPTEHVAAAQAEDVVISCWGMPPACIAADVLYRLPQSDLDQVVFSQPGSDIDPAAVSHRMAMATKFRALTGLRYYIQGPIALVFQVWDASPIRTLVFLDVLKIDAPYFQKNDPRDLDPAGLKIGG